MKRLLLRFCTFAFFTGVAHATGVAIVDAGNGVYLKIVSNSVKVLVENQVAIVTTEQTFVNKTNQAVRVKYGFPMPEGASATELVFKVDNKWFRALFTSGEQDTTLPGSGGNKLDQNLKTFLGPTPLFYNIQHDVQPGKELVVRLTYVQLLKYEKGLVNFFYPADIRLLQLSPLNTQSFTFELRSGRTITQISTPDFTADTLTNDGHQARIVKRWTSEVPRYNFTVQYQLSINELGLWGMSTYLPDSLIPDKKQHGFFTFLVEPDPSDATETLKKVFTLIVDKSGSMYGSKFTQAQNAAKFIVNHLNPGDEFNLIFFSSEAKSFRADHVPFNETNRLEALNYIENFTADGGTNIAGAFDMALSQFKNAPDSTANIIIFFTDGQPTVSITDTDELLNYINRYISTNEIKVSIFTFGIGGDANKQFLTKLAQTNNGIAAFLGNDELEERITDFYMTIRNPVSTDISLRFEPASMVTETYPVNLPNLYKGQQLIVSGRYVEPGQVNVILSGLIYGQTREYNYSLNLSDSMNVRYQFLTKIWAKQKIEDLLIQYYSLSPNSTDALRIKEDIIAISLQFGVQSPFTNLSGDEDYGGGGSTGLEENIANNENGQAPVGFELLGNYPNPFNPQTEIRFRVNINLHQLIVIRIYDTSGQLVNVLTVFVDGPGIYRVVWNGKLLNGNFASSGNYFYIIDFGKGLLGGKMTLLK